MCFILCAFLDVVYRFVIPVQVLPILWKKYVSLSQKSVICSDCIIAVEQGEGFLCKNNDISAWSVTELLIRFVVFLVANYPSFSEIILYPILLQIYY